MAERRLCDSSYSELRHIRCDFEHGQLRLHGRVRSQYLKQVAQHIVADVEGVSIIVNQIEVMSAPDVGPDPLRVDDRPG
jgi:osmotically-inducible protein OsmY